MDETQNTTESNIPNAGDDISIVGSYRYELFQDAADAEQEYKNIESLKKKIDFHKTKDMLRLYTRLVERRVFHTQVGYQFLAEFREFLVEQGKEGTITQEEIAALPYITVQAGKGSNRLEREQIEYLQKENDAMRRTRGRYLIVIIAMVVLVIALFVLTVANPNVGYINTENKILNRYAAWEETLRERESKIREKEEELGIEPTVYEELTETTEEE